MEHINYCTLCKKTGKGVNLMKHYRYTKKDGTHIQKYMCRECNTIKAKTWYKNNTERAKEIVRESEKRNPGKQKARMLLNYALKTGLIEKPKQCQECGQVKKLQGHHTDYEKPTVVEWVCTHCHSEKHSK
jgi:hypothetical protein